MGKVINRHIEWKVKMNATVELSAHVSIRLSSSLHNPIRPEGDTEFTQANEQEVNPEHIPQAISRWSLSGCT